MSEKDEPLSSSQDMPDAPTADWIRERSRYIEALNRKQLSKLAVHVSIELCRAIRTLRQNGFTVNQFGKWNLTDPTIKDRQLEAADELHVTASKLLEELPWPGRFDSQNDLDTAQLVYWELRSGNDDAERSGATEAPE